VVFSSLEFIYLFMPPVLLVFFVLRHLEWENAIIWWLIAASIGFYAWWSIPHLILLIGSVILNYLLHKIILTTNSRLVLSLGIAGNLGTLAYFKYADFMIGNLNSLTGAEVPLLHIVLPLAISFFTFQQISFLYDTYVGKIEKCNFSKYCLFVVFFPQLIAGPIVLQKHTISQFSRKIFCRNGLVNFSVGSTLFVIGLFKKIVLADGVAPTVNVVFTAAESGQNIPLEAAWMGTVAYTFQIYFDFSGYCDMALGLARMFGIRLPINFNSPYKALNIVDFWRCWHITLSAFLKSYLYIPLGGSRKGLARRYTNLTITMLLGGLWHGASWNFVFWGLLHGIYLSINHAWSYFMPTDENSHLFTDKIRRFLSQCLTMLCVMVAWVFFRAETFPGAWLIIEGMFGLTEYYDPKFWNSTLRDTGYFWMQACLMACIVFILPNSIEFVRRYKPVIDLVNFTSNASSNLCEFISKITWRPSPSWSVCTFIVGLVSLIQIYRLDELTEFIYFNF
jgi:alginate O-acetyltransferase complex protein AlgI